MKPRKKNKLFKSLFKSGDISVSFPDNDLPDCCVLTIAGGKMLLECTDDDIVKYAFAPEEADPDDDYGSPESLSVQRSEK
ncbi:hypothetical protein [Nitrobacter vulgaris]|nr:hypothetical protein [Nitrobacter vulgaris]